MADIKLLIAISAHNDMDLFYMNTTTALISAAAALQPGMVIYYNPPSGVDLGLRSNGFPSKWKLLAPLNCTYTAAISWIQSSRIRHCWQFLFVLILFGFKMLVT